MSPHREPRGERRGRQLKLFKHQLQQSAPPKELQGGPNGLRRSLRRSPSEVALGQLGIPKVYRLSSVGRFGRRFKAGPEIKKERALA